MLDLTKIAHKLYEIKTPEGDILHIKRPSQNLLNKMMNIREEDMENPEIVNEIYEVLNSIFNMNTDDKTYDKEYTSQFDLTVVAMILEDYFNFITRELGE